MHCKEEFVLRNGCLHGLELPEVAFGTYHLKKTKVVEPLTAALGHGFSLVDTAFVYNNETEVGALLARLDPEKKVLLVTKLWRSHFSHKKEDIEKTLEDHLRCLGRPIDLWLIHFPGPGRHPHTGAMKPAEFTPKMRHDTFGHMLALRGSERVRAVGVSNFCVRHMEELFAATGEWPAANQLEVHPLCQRRDIVSFCHSRGIVVMVYGLLHEKIRTHPTVVEVARDCGSSPGAVLFSWAKKKQLLVVFGSTSAEHIEQNAVARHCELSEAQMAALDEMEEKCGTFVDGWKGIVNLENIE